MEMMEPTRRNEALVRPPHRILHGRGRVTESLAAGLMLTFLLLPAKGDAAPQQPPSAHALSAEGGARVFREKGCSECHSIRGLGGKEAPDLGRSAVTATFYSLATAMWNHMPAMTTRMRELGIEGRELDAAEIEDLVVFLHMVSDSGAPGDSAAGRELFARRGCIRCHQVGGIGGVAGPNLDNASGFDSPIEVATAMWNHGPAMAQAMRERSIDRGTITGSELIDLFAYFRSSSPRPREAPSRVLPGSTSQGGELYVAKSCSACHGPEGRGGRAPNLAQRGRDQTLTDFAAAMWNKAPRMMSDMEARGLPAPELSAAQMADIVAYLYSLAYFGEAGNPALGRRWIREKGCTGCHSESGEGRPLVPSAEWDSPGTVIAGLWKHSLLPAPRPEDAAPWPTFTERELADVIAYLQPQN